VESSGKQIIQLFILLSAFVLFITGLIASVTPRGHFSFSFHQPTTYISPIKEAGRTVTVSFPDVVALANLGPDSHYKVTFSNPQIAMYFNYTDANNQHYPALGPQNRGYTKVTLQWLHHTVAFTLVVK
jgi:hypothetical protein